jgi:hypothetical protein
MIELGQCEITSVFGPMASGKTHLIGLWRKEENRYVIFDATGETMDDATVEHVWRSPRQLYERLKKNPYFFRIAYHPGTNIREDFYWVCKCLWRLDSYKILICDEFHEVCSVSETPQFVQTMMRYARHDRLAVIGASQRIADVHKLFTSGSRKVVIFYTQEARDLIAVRDRWGSEAEEMVANLRPLLYDDRTKVTRQIPQCLVITKGASPAVYDFKTESFVDDTSAESEPELEDDAENTPAVSEEPDSGDEPISPEGSNPDAMRRDI